LRVGSAPATHQRILTRRPARAPPQLSHVRDGHRGDPGADDTFARCNVLALTIDLATQESSAGRSRAIAKPHGWSRAESPAQTTALASGDHWPARPRFGPTRLASGPCARCAVMGSECGSPRAVLSPSSCQGVGDGCGDSRGSNVAFRGITADPTTAIRAVVGSSVHAGPVGGLAQSPKPTSRTSTSARSILTVRLRPTGDQAEDEK
jgi:hypothetical protein